MPNVTLVRQGEVLRAKILELYAELGNGLTYSTLCKHLGRAKSTIHMHVTRLKREGKINPDHLTMRKGLEAESLAYSETITGKILTGVQNAITAFDQGRTKSARDMLQDILDSSPKLVTRYSQRVDKQ